MTKGFKSISVTDAMYETIETKARNNKRSLRAEPVFILEDIGYLKWPVKVEA